MASNKSFARTIVGHLHHGVVLSIAAAAAPISTCGVELELSRRVRTPSTRRPLDGVTARFRSQHDRVIAET